MRTQESDPSAHVPTLELDEDDQKTFAKAFSQSALNAVDWENKQPTLPSVTEELQSTIVKNGLAETALGKTLQLFAKRKTNHGLMIVSGFPSSLHPIVSLSLCCYLMGQIQHIPEEGDYIIQVRERPDLHGGRPSFANNQPFTLHTDLSYSEGRPNFMILQSVRNAPEDAGFSVFSDVNSAIQFLSKDSIRELSAENFLFPAPSHYQAGGFVKSSILQPSASNPTQFFIRFRRDELRTLSRESLIAVLQLVQALDRAKVEFMLPEGSLVIADNWRVLHGRTGFLTNPDPLKARVLNRVYVKP